MILYVPWIVRRGVPAAFRFSTECFNYHVKHYTHSTIDIDASYMHSKSSIRTNLLNNQRRLKYCPYKTLNRNMCSTNQSALKPEVIVEPSGHLLVDDELQLSVRGLDRGQSVTIHAVIDISGKSIESFCHFKADEYGVVDLYSHPSLSGSYTGVSPMGIFWSMAPTPQMPKGFRLSFKDIDKPMPTEIDIYNGSFTADEIRSQNPTPIATHVVERWYKGEGVTCIEVTDGRLRGKLFLPPGPGPFPGVIDLFGTVGGIMEFRSALLASRGFASFTLPYFLYKDLPKDLFNLDLDYFLEAVSWLLAHPEVYGTGVGVVGVSKGADIGFMMAANCQKVRALVNINGCTFNANFPMKYSGGDISCIEMDLGRLEGLEGAWSTCNSFTYDEKDLIPVHIVSALRKPRNCSLFQAAVTRFAKSTDDKVWHNNPKILNIMSEDDLCSPKECIPFMKEHYPADKRDNFVILRYPDAGHLVEPAYTPCCRMSYHKSFDTYFMWGGKPEPHAYAQEDSWKKILTFLHTNIPKSQAKSSKL